MPFKEQNDEKFYERYPSIMSEHHKKAEAESFWSQKSKKKTMDARFNKKEEPINF